MNSLVNSLLLAAEVQIRPGQGLIVGGWEYVWAAWGITWGAIALYAVSLWLRRNAAEAPKEPS